MLRKGIKRNYYLSTLQQNIFPWSSKSKRTATLSWKLKVMVFDTHMTASLSGLKGNCLTSQRKLLAERDISKRDTSDEGKKCCAKEVALCSHLWTQEPFTAGASLHALPQKSIGLKSLSNTNLWALYNSPCNSHVHSLRALQHFILQISFTCQPPYPWNSHETSLIKSIQSVGVLNASQAS